MFFKTKEGGSLFDSASPRLTFMLGLILGLAVLSLLGFFVLLGVFLKGGTLTDRVAKADTQVVVNDPAARPEPSQPVQLVVSDGDHIRGNKNAPITIVEFSDFECPFCGRFHPTMQQVMQEYGDKVRWVYKHFPLDSIHPNARPAAEASECAAEQNKFWEFADKLFLNQQSLSTDFYTATARELGLDVNKFSSCVSTRKYQSVVDKGMQEGLSAGVNGTPSNFINGIPVSGAVPFQDLKQVIDSQLQ